MAAAATVGTPLTPSAQASPSPPSTLPLLLAGARTQPSGAVFKLVGHVGPHRFTALLDSGASGPGFINPAFVERCGLSLAPSANTVQLADGTIVPAAGQVAVDFTLAPTTGAAIPFRSVFTATPLESYDVILGVGWLEAHDVNVGWRSRSLEVRTPGRASRHIRPLHIFSDLAAPEQLATISAKALRKALKKGTLETAYAVLIRPAPEAVDPGGPPESKPKVNTSDSDAAALVAEFIDVFPDKLPAELPPMRGVEHGIELKPGSRPPPARPLRQQSSKDAAVINEFLQKGVAAGQLRVSHSPYGSMLVIVKKKDGTPRVCVDYRALNDLTIKNKYPLPLMDELFDRVHGSRFFSTIDLRDGFYQIRLAEGDIEKTAFRTAFGSYEYTVLPMGLCNAPGTFMQLMNDTFRDLLNRSVLCFLDDILIFSKTREEHLAHIREVLERLRKHKLYGKLSKCVFMSDEVGFLGHRLGANGLAVAPDKISAVRDWPAPRNAHDVRSFLGLAGFYRKFVKDFSKLALPMTELTHEKCPWTWGAVQKESFEALKASLCSAPVLLIPDPSLPYTLNTDACNYAIGATLQQDHGNGLQPVAYRSKKLSPAERNYDTREKEFMALFDACSHWRHYLHNDEPFTLRTDHESLKYVQTMPHMSNRIARWMEKMADFHYKIEHIAGTKNVVADALSRRHDLQEADAAPPHASSPAPAMSAASAQLRSCLKPTSYLNALLRPRAGALNWRQPLEESPAEAALRQKHRDAAEKVLPPDPDMPAPKQNGTIETPSQRCTAQTRAGGHCKQRTAIGQYCWSHLKSLEGLRVKKSDIAGGGRGLFAARPLPAGKSIAYTGDLIELQSGEVGGTYVLETRARRDGSSQAVDAARRNSGYGRWVNDPRGTDQRANSKFVLFTPPGGQRRIASVRTLKALAQGEEILVSYGSTYWRFHQAEPPRQPRKQQRKRRQGAREVIELDALQSASKPSTAPSAQECAGTFFPERRNLDLRRHWARTKIFLPCPLGTQKSTFSNFSPASQNTKKGSEDSGSTLSSDLEAPSGVVATAQAPLPLSQLSVSVARPASALTPRIVAAAKKDAAYQRLVASPSPHLVIAGGMLFDDTRMLVPDDAELRTAIFAECHDAVTGAHFGRDKTLEAARRRFTWPGMATDVDRYVASCDACQRNKPSQQLTPGPLMPLPIPERPCMAWTQDAVTGLPRTQRGHDAIQVYVERLCKLKHFAAARSTDGAVELAAAFVHNVVRLHGVPEVVVSDRDPRFTAHFYTELSRLMGITLSMSTAHHAQTDGQSEREIKTLITALRAFCNDHQDDWDDYLDMLELGFNSAVQASTKSSPHELVYGVAPRLPIDVALDTLTPRVPAAVDRAARMKQAFDFARGQLADAQERQARNADRHRRELKLAVGDQVLLSTEHLTLRNFTNKLCSRFVGPFPVTKVVNANAFELKLPPQLQALHPVFNISRLKPYVASNPKFATRPQRFGRPPPEADTDTNGDKVFEVERIVAARGRGRGLRYLVAWKGYPPEENTWEPRAALANARNVLAEFEATHGRVPDPAGS